MSGRLRATKGGGYHSWCGSATWKENFGRLSSRLDDPGGVGGYEGLHASESLVLNVNYELPAWSLAFANDRAGGSEFIFKTNDIGSRLGP